MGSCPAGDELLLASTRVTKSYPNGHLLCSRCKPRSRKTKHDMFKPFELILRPDPSRTVIRPFTNDYPVGFTSGVNGRTRAIVGRILALTEAQVRHDVDQMMIAFGNRHRDIHAVVLRRFDEIADQLVEAALIDDNRKLLIGAYFSNEYAFEAAALFNPSIVILSDDQNEGPIQFVLSLRGIGEGHVSSITFRTGTWTPGGALTVDPASKFAVAPIIELQGAGDLATVTLHCGGSRDPSETVLFPVLPSQHQGIEDLRLVRFTDDDGSICYHGTYTAFDGLVARSELLSGSDFDSFSMHRLTGSAAQGKGMALFPRRVDGRYAMLGRQDNENIWLHYSDEITHWEGGEKLMAPAQWWEFIQIGNCGSPIEIDEGWLVLTHGVGTVRNYCLGAALLDKSDPSKVLARTAEPVLVPGPEQRDGYVPNVVYSCGALVHGRTLLLPYGVADSFTAFASADLGDLIAAMS